MGRPNVTSSGERYWAERQANYPFQVKTRFHHKLKPREAELLTEAPLLRVPFKSRGLVCWGFKTHQALEKFRKIFSSHLLT